MKKGWETKKLGECFKLQSGDCLTSKAMNPGAYPVFGGNGIAGMHNEFNLSGDNVIVGRVGALCGNARHITEQIWLTDNAFKVADYHVEFDGSFLTYLLNYKNLRSLARQAAQPVISNSSLKDLELSFPDVREQQRIVGILDEAFEGIATAKANAEKNLQNARALFESHLQSVFTQRGEGWVETKLDDVCGFQNGFAFKSSTFKPSGAPILRISNIQDGRVHIENRLVFFDPKDYRENLDRYRVVEGDLLIAMSGATTGKLGFNTENTVFYLNQRVGKFEPGKKLNNRFLYHFLSTKVEENLRISAGAAQPNLSTEQIKGFVLPLPDINEQEGIVDALESLSEETQRLATIYERKLASLDDLKKSLLHEAFSGKL